MYKYLLKLNIIEISLQTVTDTLGVILRLNNTFNFTLIQLSSQIETIYVIINND